MSTRSNKRKRERQKLRAKQRQQQTDLLATRGLVAKLAEPITSRSVLGAAIQEQQQP